MKCQRCGSTRVMSFHMKCHDSLWGKMQGKEYEDPKVRGINHGGYMQPSICLDCGQCKGKFPVKFSGTPFVPDPGPSKEDIYVTLNAWHNAQEDHKCEEKHLVCSDWSGLLMAGTTCCGCGKQFYIRLCDIKTSMPDVTQEFRNLMKTPQGRIAVVNNINKGV